MVNAGDRGHTQLRGLGGETAQGPWRIVAFWDFPKVCPFFWGEFSGIVGVPRVFFGGCSHVFFDFWTMIEDVLCVFCCFPQFVLRYTILRELVVSILGWAFPKIVIFNTVFRNKMASVLPPRDFHHRYHRTLMTLKQQEQRRA